MKIKLSFLSILVMMLVVACSTNAITGRKQLSLVSETEVQNMAKTEYRQFLSTNNVIAVAIRLPTLLTISASLL